VPTPEGGQECLRHHVVRKLGSEPADDETVHGRHVPVVQVGEALAVHH
jgi:hypothetical protein